MVAPPRTRTVRIPSRWPTRAAVGLLVGFAAAACSSTTEPFVLTVGGGLDGPPLADPAVVSVELRVRSLAGAETAVATAKRAAGGLDLPDAAKSGQGSLAVAGVDGGGKVLVYGRTIPVDLGGLTDAQSSITVFAQRVGSLARAMNLPRAPKSPRCVLVGVRYLVIGEAASTSLQVVDLLRATVSDEASALPFAPETLASAGGYVLALSAKGEAARVDLEAGSVSTPSAPTGAAFADVVGGAVVVGDDGAAFVVGATRPTGPTDLVLRLATDGTLAARRLGVARAGAAATTMPGRGIVVAYGAPVGPVELLAPTATNATTLPFAASAGPGGLLAAWDGNRLLRVVEGGAATTLDLSCASGCTEVAALEAGAGPGATALALEGGGVVAVRANAVQLLDGTKATGLGAAPTGTCAVALPTGLVAVVSDGDATLRTVLGPRR